MLIDKEMAFPVRVNDNLTQLGMTLRDYFAAKAMQSIVFSYMELIPSAHAEEIASDAYLMADAMLKARETTTEDI